VIKFQKCVNLSEHFQHEISRRRNGGPFFGPGLLHEFADRQFECRRVAVVGLEPEPWQPRDVTRRVHVTVQLHF